MCDTYITNNANKENRKENNRFANTLLYKV